MKKYIKYLWLLALSVAVSSCEDYFEHPLTQDITVTDIFADETTAQTFLDGAYAILPVKHATQTTDGNTDKIIKICSVFAHNAGIISDEGACGRANSNNQFMYQLGTLNATEWDKDVTSQSNATQRMEDIMMSRYIYIRKCLLYLQYVNTIPNASATFVKETSAQAKALMAFYYVEMMKRYGSVPYLTEVTNEDADLLTIGTRPPLSEFVDFVDGLIVEAIADLPESYDTADLGRFSRAAAYGLRSRLWLLAASPLFNKQTSAHIAEATAAEHYGEASEFVNYSTSYDSSLWTKAAQYSKEAIDYCTSKGYSLVNTGDPKSDVEKATIDTPDNGNTECLLFRRYTNTTAHITNFIAYSVPYGTKCTVNATGIRGIGGVSISQNHVNMYRNADGSTWSDELTDDEGNIVITTAQRQHYASHTDPWEDLEPRFMSNVIHDKQSIVGFLGEDNPFVYDHDTSNITSAVLWGLGYSSKRFLRDDVLAVHNTTDYIWDLINVEMRLAEIYLNYAEALLGTGDVSGAMDALKVTMRRGGLPVDTMTFPTDADLAFNWVVRERAVELLNEGFRYFDCKRWLRGDWIAGEKIGVMNKTTYTDKWDGDVDAYQAEYGITGLNDVEGYIIREGAYYVQYLNNTFDKRQYFFPIIQTEMLRKCGWVQNPGY